ncbi:hypothetical protein SAMN05421639_101153 [Chryseobacterium shigense]|uniref:Uncharacterized protein n=1 Tax=Chryseobacterium shigense TaxID=297244 RepID=A0A1N7HUD0_9FLAO|nr:hypothetical protein SAMN05421639_101153 [Chryseobacterium shigense]
MSDELVVLCMVRDAASNLQRLSAYLDRNSPSLKGWIFAKQKDGVVK